LALSCFAPRVFGRLIFYSLEQIKDLMEYS